MPDQGTYAERIVVNASQLRPRPHGYTWIEAAALPLGGLTAWRAVVTHAEARVDRTLLVPGAGGGVATFVIQIAAAIGARVLVRHQAQRSSSGRAVWAPTAALTTTRRTRRNGSARSTQSWTAWVAELAGALRALRPGGRLVSFGDTAGEVAEVELARVFLSWIRIQGTTMGSPREFDALLRHVAEARWRAVVDSVFPLREAAAAHERLDAGDRFGKVVLAVDESRL